MCAVNVSGNNSANTENAAIKKNDKGRNNTPAIIKMPVLISTKAINSVKASGLRERIGNL